MDEVIYYDPKEISLKVKWHTCIY